jgi:hypothetical protein
MGKTPTVSRQYFMILTDLDTLHSTANGPNLNPISMS